MKVKWIKSCLNCAYGKIIDEDKEIVLCQSCNEHITEVYDDAMYCGIYLPREEYVVEVRKREGEE